MLRQISWKICTVKWGTDSSEKDEAATLWKQRKSSSEQIIDVQEGTCWVEWKLAAAAPAFFQNTHTAAAAICFFFFAGVWSSHFQWKIVILILDCKMGGTKQQDPKVFAYVTICIFVLSWIFLCLSWLNWSMASGLCLCRPTWLVINSSPTNWIAGGAWPFGRLLDLMHHADAVTGRNSHGLLQHFLCFRMMIITPFTRLCCKYNVALVISDYLVDLWGSWLIGGQLSLSHDSNCRWAQQWPMTGKVCGFSLPRKQDTPL
jgi:hypothetical protein